MNTRELRLAVAHRVIAELNDVGKTRLQKLSYFLQESFQVPTKYSFRMHHYGPYSEALETDMARLQLTGYVAIRPDLQGYGFHISPTDTPEKEWVEISSQFGQSIDDALEIFREWSPSKLELAATIHFVANLLPHEPESAILSKVRALKPKFAPQYVSQVRDELDRLGLLNQ